MCIVCACLCDVVSSMCFSVGLCVYVCRMNAFVFLVVMYCVLLSGLSV